MCGFVFLCAWTNRQGKGVWEQEEKMEEDMKKKNEEKEIEQNLSRWRKKKKRLASLKNDKARHQQTSWCS